MSAMNIQNILDSALSKMTTPPTVGSGQVLVKRSKLYRNLKEKKNEANK